MPSHLAAAQAWLSTAQDTRSFDDLMSAVDQLIAHLDTNPLDLNAALNNLRAVTHNDAIDWIHLSTRLAAIGYTPANVEHLTIGTYGSQPPRDDR